MSRNIHNLSAIKIAAAITALFALSGCGTNIKSNRAVNCRLGSRNSQNIISLPINEPASDKAAAVSDERELEFAAEYGEPDGTTLSLIEYANAYCAFWRREAGQAFAAYYGEQGAAELAAFEEALEVSLTEYREEFRADFGSGQTGYATAIYGREAGFMVELRRGELLRDKTIELENALCQGSRAEVED